MENKQDQKPFKQEKSSSASELDVSFVLLKSLVTDAISSPRLEVGET